MKTTTLIKLSFTVILLITITSACKKPGQDDNGSSGELKNLLIGSPGYLWQLQGADASTVWEDQVGGGWKQYTNQPGTINLTDCVKNNDYIVFNADNSYTQATYTCNLFETNFPLFKQIGGTGHWSLANDNTLTFENYATYRLVSVTATDLFIADLYGTYHFGRVSAQPFLTPVKQLCGADTKTWKIGKIKRGGVEQPLTVTQTATLLTFNVNGALTSSYTNSSFGQPLTGTWAYDLSQSKCVFTFPLSGQTPAVNQTCTVLELTQTTFTYYYFDTQNNYFTIYLVLQ